MTYNSRGRAAAALACARSASQVHGAYLGVAEWPRRGGKGRRGQQERGGRGHGADNSRVTWRWCGSMVASHHGHVEVVRLLLRASTPRSLPRCGGRGKLAWLIAVGVFPLAISSLREAQLVPSGSVVGVGCESCFLSRLWARIAVNATAGGSDAPGWLASPRRYRPTTP